MMTKHKIALDAVVTWIGLIVSLVVIVVYGFLEAGDWAVSCAVAGVGFGVFAGSWWTEKRFRSLVERYSFSCPEEALCYYDAVVNGRVLSSGELPESARKALEDLGEDDA